GGVEYDLDAFGVLRGLAGDLVVGGSVLGATVVAGGGVEHALYALEDGLLAPEASAGKDSDLLAGVRGKWSVRSGCRDDGVRAVAAAGCCGEGEDEWKQNSAL